MRPDRPRPTACLRGRSCPEGWVQERRSPERSGLFSGRRSEQPDDGRIGDGSELGKLRGQVARRTAQVRHRLAGVDAEQRPISGISWPNPRAPFGDSARMEPRPLIDQHDEVPGEIFLKTSAGAPRIGRADFRDTPGHRPVDRAVRAPGGHRDRLTRTLTEKDFHITGIIGNMHMGEPRTASAGKRAAVRQRRLPAAEICHCMTWFGCTSNCGASSGSVFSPPNGRQRHLGLEGRAMVPPQSSGHGLSPLSASCRCRADNPFIAPVQIPRSTYPAATVRGNTGAIAPNMERACRDDERRVSPFAAARTCQTPPSPCRRTPLQSPSFA